MGNRYFQQARSAVEEATEAMSNSYTPLNQSEANEKIQRAKQALSQAFADSTLAEREQLMNLQNQLYEFSEEFSTETR
ncbi:DUF3813 domain-containing protein [Evansella sp. AB-P1]|uniref:DUF3813 domain-containing protein n=1 Tax=Evansella sp. AB-P1 TaxID=3037653 RepID=UPI00241E1905|nr:DUF3813 domain-containing protein [Evansella sp. AB-P1]MDG5789183.1 DUF3813 domain-containing protein [Evansella sp. AB-P1]